MNKTEMIKKVSVVSGYTQKDIAEVLDVVVATIIEAVAAGDEVNIAGFGKFSVSARPEREGRNPQTGETIVIAASKNPKFKASKNFKDTVNA